MSTGVPKLARRLGVTQGLFFSAPNTHFETAFFVLDKPLHCQMISLFRSWLVKGTLP